MARDYVLQPFRPAVDLRIDYAAELNPQQRAAVTAPPGPGLVIAGAGSGKTRTLTYRVAFLIEQGIPADRILLLTFTNKAAREMMGRVATLLGGDHPALWGGTFHSIGNRILRRHAELIGYPRGFTILDREDARDLIKTCVGESGLDDAETRFPKAEVLADLFSLAVNTARPLPELIGDRYGHFAPLADRIEELQLRYAARKQAAGGMDFDDLLVNWLRLMREHDSVLEQYQHRFQFLLVDEYQDTNRLQSDLIDLLAARHKNVMVVGDDSQSIYSWRGASFDNIFEFPKRYPTAQTYMIETNYRSTPEILSLANAAIAANTRQFAKHLAPARRPGIRPLLVPCGEAGEQAAFVAQRVLELREEGMKLEEMAVLYRSHFHALELQLELTRRNIPFSITSGIRFFEQAHVKDVASFLKFVANPRDELAFKRIVRLLPGIGAKAADRLWNLHTAGLDVRSAGADGCAASLQACAPGVPRKSTVAWAQFTATLAQISAAGVRDQPSLMIRIVREALYEDYLKESYPDYRTRLDDLLQLEEFARKFQVTGDFLAQLALLTNVEAEDDRPAARDSEELRLSTIHQAKGLEFSVVFIIMLCDGLFPSARSLETPEGEEEERRLFYVAVTRARDELYLTYPLIRFTQGRGGDMMQTPSRFLSEIPVELREELALKSFNAYG